MSDRIIVGCLTVIIFFFLHSSCFTQELSASKIISPNGAMFQGLGDLSGGIFASDAQCVSADGNIVVGSSNSDKGTQAVMWTENTGMISLGNLFDNSYKQSWGESISANGEVVVGYGDPVGSGWETYKGFIWTEADGMNDIGCLDGSSRYMPFAVSADGTVVVGDGGQQAFLWKKNESITGLGVLPGKSNSRAIAVSADGSVVTGSSYNSDWSLQETFRWTQSEGMQAIGYLPGTTISFPNAISPDGSVIAGTSSNSSGAYAYRWSQSIGMVNIGSLPGTYVTHPASVSENGEIIVGGSYVDMNNAQAFIWDSTNGIGNLKAVLENEYSLDLAGWTLQNASSITPDGKVIVGWGINPSGNQEAFRVVLDTTSTGVREEKVIIEEYKLDQNYPNPFNPSTRISYSLPGASNVRLSIYNLLGQEVKTLVNTHQNAGEYSLVWNATDERNNPVSSGIYFYQMKTKNRILQKKMLLIR